VKIELNPTEARVLGCLLEKEVTTPEQYPLSLNSLASACNQKSNRDPLLDLPETAVQQAIDSLVRQHLVSDRAGYGGRVPKYRQVLCNTEFGTLRFTGLERAIVCELLLRGPQSAGELRTRCARMATVSGGDEVEAALKVLMEHGAGPFVVRLPRAAGQRDLRYAHLLGGEVAGAPAVPGAGAAADAATPAAAPAGTSLRDLAARVEHLELQLADLQREVAALRDRPGPC
jgi:uncharacterized protein YceH (UPF0502 family)